MSQTDAVSFFQDFGTFPGTGTNIDGSIGYQVRDNALAGGAYTIYAGRHRGAPADSVQNMVITGNKFSRQWWPRGGKYGVISAGAAWGSHGNIYDNNTFAGDTAGW